MKPRKLSLGPLLLLVVMIVGTIWWFTRTPESTTEATDLVKSAAKAVAPQTEKQAAQVESPKAPAVPAKSEIGESIPVVVASANNDLRANLNTAISEAIRLLDNKDYANYFKQFSYGIIDKMPPDVLEIESQQFNQNVQQYSDLSKDWARHGSELHQIQSQTPAMSKDGNTATFAIPLLNNDVDQIVLKKHNGLWSEINYATLKF